jgi:predicted DNA-binding transcriptional regulator AlpA
MDNTSTTQQLMTANDLAAELGLGPQTLAQWRWQGVGPAYVKVGQRLVRYRRGDVDTWLSTGESNR